MRLRSTIAVILAVAGAAAGCGSTQPRSEGPTAVTSPVAPVAPVAPTEPAPGTVPPVWLGKRVLPRTASGYGEQRPTPKVLRDRRFTLPDTLPELPGSGFVSRVEPAPAAVIARSTWRPGCPVRAADLSWVRLTFRGFDHRRHTGELLVNATAAAPLVRVFHQLYDAGFPIEEMRITRAAEQAAPPTGDGNDTGAFDCRPTVGSTSYSQHAYGTAIDVDPFQNPYHKGDLVLPELASAYLLRSWHRPGMIYPDGVVVRAFHSIGWGWGGDFTKLKDLQHFSAEGR